MLVLTSLIAIHILSMILNVSYTWKDRDDDFIGFLIFMTTMSIIPIVSQTINIFVLMDIYESNIKLNKQYNRVIECRECGLYSRYGNLLINELKTNRMECPHCNSIKWKDSELDINTELPLAPKLNNKQIKEYLKLKKQKEEFSLVDSQLEKYNALQQRKLNNSYDDAIDRLEQMK